MKFSHGSLMQRNLTHIKILIAGRGEMTEMSMTNGNIQEKLIILNIMIEISVIKLITIIFSFYKVFLKDDDR